MALTNELNMPLNKSFLPKIFDFDQTFTGLSVSFNVDQWNVHLTCPRPWVNDKNQSLFAPNRLFERGHLSTKRKFCRQQAKITISETRAWHRWEWP